ncbi:MAG: hypothetical protein RLZZ450_55 [Pseudomonadota bacterium]|jgi:hypothetical protein
MTTRNTKDLYFDSPAQIQCFAEAWADRIAWLNGEATEMHLEEPKRSTQLTVRPPRMPSRRNELPPPAHLDLGSRFSPF